MKQFKLYIFLFLVGLVFNAHAQPNPVTTGSATTIATSSVTLNGSIGVVKETSYFFQYGTASDLSGATSTVAVILPGLVSSTENVSENISALSAETRYYFRLIASDVDAEDQGSIQSFRTLSNVLSSQVSDFSVRDNGTTNIRLEWTAAASSDCDGYLIIYKEGAVAPDPAGLQNGVHPGSQPAIGANIIEVLGSATDNKDITGLIAATQYSFIIVPYNFDGSNNETFHYNKTTYGSLSAFTLYPEPSSHSGVPTLVATTENSITISFTGSNDISPGVPATGYLISYVMSDADPDSPTGLDGTDAATTLTPTAGDFTIFSTDPTVEVEIAGLNPQSEYSFRVTAFSSDPGHNPTSFNYKTDDGGGEVINSLFTLSEEPSTSLAPLVRTGASPTQIDFSFGANSFGGYVLYYQAGTSPVVSGVLDGLSPDAGAQASPTTDYTWEKVDGSATISTNGGIIPGTKYFFTLVPYNSDGTNDGTINYKTSSPATLTAWSKSSNPSAAVANLVADNPTASSFDVTYDAVTADGYLAVYGTSTFDVTDIVDELAPASQTVTNGTVVDLGNVTTATISSLLANTAYEVSIIPYKVADDGGPVAETYNYRTGGALTESISTICAAPTNQAAFSSTVKTATTIDLNWNTVVGADRYLILAKQGADPDFTPISGNAYSGNGDFAAATTVGTDTKILLAGAYPAQPFTITNLLPNTEYRFEIYAYNNTDNCYNTTLPGTATVSTDLPAANNTLSLISEGAVINSVTNDINNGFATVLTFDMVDGGADNANTFLSGFEIIGGISDYFVTQAIDWTAIIGEARLVNTTHVTDVIKTLTIEPTGNTLTVSIAGNENNNANDFGYIADGGTIRMELQIKLKDGVSVTDIDNKNFSFEVNPASITFEGSNSSTFDTSPGTTITSDPTQNRIEVTATKFSFTTQPPATINAGEDMSPQPVFEARDANNNVDLDFGAAFTITNADNIPMNNAPTTGFTNGVHTFPVDFNYQGSGDGRLTITSGGITRNSSAVTVVPTVSYATLTTGLNAGELDAGTTDQAVIGVAITSLGSTSLNEIVLHQDLTIANKIENVRLYLSANDTYEGIGTETAIAATVSVDNGAAKTITFSTFTESINSTTKYFFVVVDVNAGVNEFDTPDLTLSVDQADFGYTTTVNNTAYAASEVYSFNDIIEPEVTAIDAEYAVISDSDAGNTFTLSITFNEEMDNTLNPSISFPVESPSTTLSINTLSSNWSAGNTVFNAVYDVSDINIDVAAIDVRVENARDKSLNTQVLNTTANIFNVDTRNPTVAIALSNSLITVANPSITFTATFNEAMDAGQLPAFIISGSTNLSANGAGIWSVGNTVYTQNFIHNGTEEEIGTNAIEVSLATDIYGNVMVTKSSGNFAVDTEPAKITDIFSSSSNGLYGPADAVNITITFDDNIDVAGNPKLILNTTGGEATYVGHGTNQITFNYIVGAVGSNQNTLDLNVISLILNGSSIKDVNTNDVDLNLPVGPNNLSDNANIAIDTKAAVVLDVSSLTPDGFYKEGDLIQLLITFDEDVTVSGNPELILALDNASTAKAVYASPQSSKVLIFEYLVAAGENVNPLEYSSITALTLAGGNILDPADIASNLSLPNIGGGNSLADNSAIVIDTEVPLLASDAFKPANDSLNVSHISNFKIEFNEEVLGAGKNNVRLFRFSDDQLVKSFDADTLFNNANAITLLTKSLEANIADTTVYYLEFDAGAVVDKAGNPYAGFTGNTFWKFTSAGPSRIDTYSEGACVGEEFIILGEYFTGVTKIEVGGGVVSYAQSDFTITEKGDSILFLVKANTNSGVINLIKEVSKSNNTETFNSTSSGDIFVGPSSAQITVTPIDICNDGSGGVADVIQFSVDVVGGSGTYSIVYNNGVEDVSVDGYDNGSDIELTPPVIGTNTYTLVSVVDNDAVLSSCGVPSSSLGSNIAVEKYERSVVNAGGGVIDSETGFGSITVCIAETDNIDFSDVAQVGALPEILGDVTTGIWTIIGGGASSGGFSPAKNSTTTTIQPTYYFSLDDVARGEVILQLQSNDPVGNNPCLAASDRVVIRFVSSSQATPATSSLEICTELVNGEQVAIAALEAIKGGGATDILWTRDSDADAAAFDGSWGFANSPTAATFSLTSTDLTPFYKASPAEMTNNFAKVYVEAIAGSCGTSLADSVPLSINIRKLLAPSLSSQAGVNPSEVCSGANEEIFKVNASSPNSSFVWKVTNAGVDALNQNDKNEIATAPVDSLYGNTITINFREVSTDVIETVTVYELKDGCLSETISMDVVIKASPIAEIISKPSSTINNSTTNFPLVGQGGFGTNLAIEGVFTGKGVIEKSDGTFILNTTSLSPTSVLNPNDDYQIIYTFTTALGCSATDTTRFDVFDEENSFPDLGEVYCEDVEPFEITLDNAVLGPGFQVINIFGPGNSAGVTFIDPDTTTVYKALVDPRLTLADNGGLTNVTITYSTLNIASGEITEAAGSQSVIINPLPETAADQLEDSYCTSANLVFLRKNEAENPNSTFEFSLLDQALTDLGLLEEIDNPKSFQLNLAVLPHYFEVNGTDALDVKVLYTYISTAGCINYDTLSTTIFKLPEAPILANNRVNYTFTVSNNIRTATETVLVADTTGSAVYWFAEGGSFIKGEEIIIGNSFVPSIDINRTSDDFYAVRFENGCVSESTRFDFYRQEPPTFGWNTAVFDENTPVIFTADDKNVGNPAIGVLSRKWEVRTAEGNFITSTNSHEGTSELLFDGFENAGVYQISYVITTDKGSTLMAANQVVVVPRVSSLLENFNDNSYNWVTTGDSTSWEKALPQEASLFTNADALWITNPNGNYKAQEESYLYSPEFDISMIEKPVLSFDLWLDIATADGMRLEYTTDVTNVNLADKVWRPLGTGINSGINWYNTALGIEDVGFAFGWSGNHSSTDQASSLSVNAKHTLSEILTNDLNGGKNVIFRFYFSSISSSTRNGVAIDNFSIESLNRTNLIEYFGNASNDSKEQEVEQMAAIGTAIINNPDLAFINYRLSEEDPIFMETASIIATRTSYYQAFSANTDFVLDGTYKEGQLLTENEAKASISNRSLVSSSFELELTQEEVDNELAITVDLATIGSMEIPANTHLMVAVVSEQLDIDNTIQYNVLHKFLPTAQGTPITAEGSYTFSYEPNSELSSKNLTVIAFLQQFKQNGDTEVYQAANSGIVSNLSYQVTGIQDAVFGEIKLYPNPAKAMVNLSISKANQVSFVRLYDMYGKLVKDVTLAPQQHHLSFDTSMLSTGLYSVIITDLDGNQAGIKLVVKH